MKVAQKVAVRKLNPSLGILVAVSNDDLSLPDAGLECGSDRA
jgi:hypothetical protein